MRTIVLAVGRTQPPYADDVQHYQKLIAGHAKLELVECREDEQVARRIPKRAHVTLLSAEGTQYDSEGFARVLEERRMSGLDWCFVIGGPFGLQLESPDSKAHGIGYSSKEKWAATQTMMAQFGGLTKTVDDVSIYYTNEFLPPN